MLNMEDSLKLLEEKVVEVRDQIYLPFIKEIFVQANCGLF